MLKLITEVLAQVHNAKSDDERMQILKKNESPALLLILRNTYTPQITFKDLGGVPEYTPNKRPNGTAFANLNSEARRLYIFTDQYQKITYTRKRELFLQLLENINPSEAILLGQVVKKNIKVTGLTPALVEKTFPGLLAWEKKPWSEPVPETKPVLVSNLKTTVSNPPVDVVVVNPTEPIMNDSTAKVKNTDPETKPNKKKTK